MQHLNWLQWNPDEVKAIILSTALPRNGSISTIGNFIGQGKLNIYPTHYSPNESNGWITGASTAYVNSTWYRYWDLYVPAGTHRVNVVATWVEPPAAIGSRNAMVNDLDLWVDAGVNETTCQAGEYHSTSRNDTKEYVTIDNPADTDTTYRVKGFAFRAVASGSTEQISVDSQIDIKLGRDDRPDVATLSIQLQDKAFDGQGTASVEVHDGKVHDEGPETFGVPAS